MGTNGHSHEAKAEPDASDEAIALMQQVQALMLRIADASDEWASRLDVIEERLSKLERARG